ncbi:ERF family protein [Brevibacillus borstelensis]|uniref:ERF family protein n=1 Tax=Brevibacillus borstelensis TaxID=45462 RepID=UPI0009DFE875|nr:ERF family protein [Brevibacillus borstelensis]
MNKSESITELSKALVKFNGEVSKIEKDSSNPHFKNRYASLDRIVDEIRPLLQKNGLSIMQFPSGDGDKVTITTVLLHESGEWIQSDPLTLNPTKKDPQGIGSATTYGRRYQLSSFLSLNTGEDDDGNAASVEPVTPNVSQPREATLKAKWQKGRGSLEGFDEWYQQQKKAGYSEQQMDSYLTKKLTEKGVS